MKDFLKFKKMIAPIIIPILFWIGVIACIITGLFLIFLGIHDLDPGGGEIVFMGFAYIFFGPIIVRLSCELLIILFSVNDKLSDIKDILKTQQDKNNQTSLSNEK